MDKLRRQCEEQLERDEQVLLEAHASLKLGLLRKQGAGKAFLTNSRLLWLHGAPSALLILMPWLRRRVELPLEGLLQTNVQFSGEVLNVTTDTERYEFRLSPGYWSLFNPLAGSAHGQTARQWEQRIRELGAKRALE